MSQKQDEQSQDILGASWLRILLTVAFSGLGLWAAFKIWQVQNISDLTRLILITLYVLLTCIALWSIWRVRNLTNVVRWLVSILFIELAIWTVMLVNFRYVISNSEMGLLATDAIKIVGPELAGIAIGVILIDFLNQRRQDEQLKLQLIRNMASHNNSVADTAIRELADRGWLQDGALVGKRFREADWQESNLREADLREVDLTSANLKGARFAQANLEGAQMVDACLMGAFLVSTNLENCNLAHARLQDSDMRRAVLRGARLWQAKLSGAHLSHADLEGANLYQTVLSGIEPGRSITLEQLKSAERLDGAVMPDGTELRDIDGDDDEKPTFEDWLEKQNPEDWSPMKRSTRR